MHEKGFGVERDVSEAMKLFLEYAIWELGEEQKKSEKNRKWVQFSFLVNQEKMSVHYYLLSNYRLLCPGFKDNSDLFTKWSNQLVSVYAANKTRVDGALSYLENSCLTNNNELYEPIDVSRVPDNILQETREALKYELGKDKPRSLNKAFEFYRLAHAKGDDFAAYMEARYLAEGVVFPADEISAHEKFLELANKGLAAAQNAIGVDFQTGIGGVQKDFREAFKWFMLAAAQGEPIAQSNIGKMLKDGTSGKFSLKESVDWFRKGAASGNPYAQCNLAYAYLNGDGVKADLQEALKLFKVSADNGSYHCQLQLGKLIEADKRVEAIHYYQLAAKHNKGEAEFRLAILLLESAQSSKDITAALNWLHKAAQNQHGTRLLAEMYEKGKYVEQSNSKALYWYQFSKNSPNDVARLEMLAKYELDKN